MKVLVLSHSSELAGAERSMLDLFDHWAKKGLVEPHFIIRRPIKNLAPELRKRGWGYTAIHYTNWSQRNPSKQAESVHRNALFNTQAVFNIEELIKELQPDVVMTNTIVAPWAALAAHFQKVPHIWFVREYGDTDHQHVFELGRENTYQDVDSLSGLVVTNSKSLAQYLRQYIDKNKITPLYTPFNLDYLRQKSLQPAKNPYKRKGSLKLVITGKITPSKGQSEATEAVGRLNKMGHDTELCIIGTPKEPGDDEPLKNIIETHSLGDKVHLIGEQSNPLAILRFADVGIMASQQEAFGRVTFEYMVVGLPVVGSNSGATPEMIEDGKNGYLYNNGSVDSLVDQLIKYASDRSLVNVHGEAAQKKAELMMKGQHNADALMDTVIAMAKDKDKHLSQPLNFSHRWLEYPDIAKQYIEDTGSVSLGRLTYQRLRHRAKLAYLWVAAPFGNHKRYK
ncbi:MAG: glycosyltransferase family 4 protein [Candidatus Saccharimonadales bacterium]